ncbi:MAG: hypothetical protein ACFFD4_28040 [Candidatus Odinarchaeota archaeon]
MFNAGEINQFDLEAPLRVFKRINTQEVDENCCYLAEDEKTGLHYCRRDLDGEELVSCADCNSNMVFIKKRCSASLVHLQSIDVKDVQGQIRNNVENIDFLRKIRNGDLLEVKDVNVPFNDDEKLFVEIHSDFPPEKIAKRLNRTPRSVKTLLEDIKCSTSEDMPSIRKKKKIYYRIKREMKVEAFNDTVEGILEAIKWTVDYDVKEKLEVQVRKLTAEIPKTEWFSKRREHGFFLLVLSIIDVINRDILMQEETPFRCTKKLQHAIRERGRIVKDFVIELSKNTDEQKKTGDSMV